MLRLEKVPGSLFFRPLHRNFSVFSAIFVCIGVSLVLLCSYFRYRSLPMCKCANSDRQCRE